MMHPKKPNFFSKKPSSTPRNKFRADKRGSWQIAGNLNASFFYAAKGISYSFKSQRNFRIHVFMGSFVFGIGFWLKLPMNEFAVLVITVSSVLVLELINTSIEAVVDLSIGRRFHPLARIAKDCSAGAVLIAAIGSLLIACYLLLPKLLVQLGM